RSGPEIHRQAELADQDHVAGRVERHVGARRLDALVAAVDAGVPDLVGGPECSAPDEIALVVEHDRERIATAEARERDAGEVAGAPELAGDREPALRTDRRGESVRTPER